MVQPEGIVSLAERLKSRREELGISQSHRPASSTSPGRPTHDRKLARRLCHDHVVRRRPDVRREAALSDVIDFARPGRGWNTSGTSKSGIFFEQVRSLIDDGAESGDINTEQRPRCGLCSSVSRKRASPWKATRGLQPSSDAPPREHSGRQESPRGSRLRRRGHPRQELETARLLVIKLVTNSVRHAPNGRRATVAVTVSVERNLLHIEVATGHPQQRASSHPATKAATASPSSTRWQAAGVPNKEAGAMSPGSTRSATPRQNQLTRLRYGHSPGSFEARLRPDRATTRCRLIIDTCSVTSVSQSRRSLAAPRCAGLAHLHSRD